MLFNCFFVGFAMTYLGSQSANIMCLPFPLEASRFTPSLVSGATMVPVKVNAGENHFGLTRNNTGKLLACSLCHVTSAETVRKFKLLLAEMQMQSFSLGFHIAKRVTDKGIEYLGNFYGQIFAKKFIILHF